MEIITSLDNNKVKYWAKLKIKKYRDEEDYFLVEGDHLVNEAYKNGQLNEIIALPDVKLDYETKVTYVSESVMKKISGMESISNIMGQCKKFNPLNYGARLLLLDDIQDPGNLGTIIRSACAFNIDTIILSLNTVDLYNPKTIRATEGMIFNIDVMKKDLSTFIKELKSNNYGIYGTDVNNGKSLNNVDFKDKFAIIIGSEGKGMNNNIKDLVDESIYIPINKKCESLNASIAASLIMYEMSKIDYE